MKKVLVPANGETPVLQLMKAIVQELGPMNELVVGFVQTPEISNDKRIAITVRLIDEVGRGRTSDIHCRLARMRDATVLGGVVVLAKQERAGVIALHNPSSQPDLELDKVVERLAKESVRCQVQVFDVPKAASLASATGGGSSAEA